MPEAFYEADGDRYLATELTRGPWDPGAQHAGPPAALLGREIERLEDAGEFQVGRVTCEILRSVPIAPVVVSARVVRPGRRVQLVEAELRDEAGEPLMRASAWRLRTAPLEIPPRGDDPGRAAARARAGRAKPTSSRPAQELGYHSAMEVRFVRAASSSPARRPSGCGCASRWSAGEEPSPLQRVLVTADVGNGVSASLDYRRYLFINVDLTVHLERMPAGEWICVDAVTLPQPSGIGTAESVLSDESGRIGRALQTLLVAER